MLALITGLAAVILAGGIGMETNSTGSYSLLFNFAEQIATWDSDSAVFIMISNVYELLRPFALTLALCYVIVEILETITRNGGSNVTVQMLVMPLIKFAAIALLIENGITLIGTVFSASNGFVEWVDSTFGELTTSNVDDMISTDVNGVMAKILFIFLPSFISVLSQCAACFMLGMQMISIKLEIALHAMFFPIAAANIAGNGGGGMRYIKGFIGDIFTLGTIMVVIRATYALVFDIGVSTVLDGYTDSDGGAIFATIFCILFQGIMGPMAAVSAVGTVKSVIKEAFS